MDGLVIASQKCAEKLAGRHVRAGTQGFGIQKNEWTGRRKVVNVFRNLYAVCLEHPFMDARATHLSAVLRKHL
ncbi:hypothetical protein Ddc_07732 [Ditylenchus destructor]|nr:hypothetical protein Ddc_07732 [Ditylenchus destructor]